MGKGYTFNEIKHFVEVESNSGCKLLSDTWIDNKTKMKFLCKCGNEFSVNMNNFRSSGKRQCNVCSEKERIDKRILSYETIKQFVKENSDCTLLSTEYNGQNEALTFKCSCGETFITNFDSFKNGNKRQCNKCGRLKVENARRNDILKVKEYVESFGCKLISRTYKNQSDNIVVQCRCGEVFNTSYYNFKYNEVHCCNKCSSELRSEVKRKSLNDVVEFIENNNCKYISGNYKNQNSKLKLQCKCGKIFETSFNEFTSCNKRQCNDCGKTSRIFLKTKTNEEFIKLVEEQTKQEYIFLEKYNGVKNKIKVKHNICNNIYNVTPDNFLNNKRRCPYCNESKTETLINIFLQNNNFIFERQYTFNNLFGVGGGLLRYDFVIFEYINKTKIKCIIEYDGEFHYIKLFEDQDFETQQIHDKLKNDYCTNNNIELIRIPYWESNDIKKILYTKLDIDKYEQVI